jgi:hypothetical protein
LKHKRTIARTHTAIITGSITSPVWLIIAQIPYLNYKK